MIGIKWRGCYLAAGGGGFSVEEVVAVCFSLQRIADQAQDSEETGRFFYDIIIPRLLTLALQAALQGKQKGFLPWNDKTWGYN